jgi:hypothetical protein
MHNLNPREVADHPLLVLLRLQQEGTLTPEDIEAEFRETITDAELLGIILGEIDDGLGDNNSGGETIEMEALPVEVKPLLPLPPKPAAAPVAEPNTLAETVLLLAQQRHSPRPSIKKASWEIAPASAPLDLGEIRPLDF